MKAKASTGTRGSFSGLPEYQLNLDVSLLLKDILEQRGYQVVMTRTDNDTAISNKERAELVASQGAEICVRIHANGDDSADVSGALTMCQFQQTIQMHCGFLLRSYRIPEPRDHLHRFHDRY